MQVEQRDSECGMCGTGFDLETEFQHLNHLMQPPGDALDEAIEAKAPWMPGAGVVCGDCWEQKIHPAAWKFAEVSAGAF